MPDQGFEYERKGESTKIIMQEDYRIKFVFEKNNSGKWVRWIEVEG